MWPRTSHSRPIGKVQRPLSWIDTHQWQRYRCAVCSDWGSSCTYGQQWLLSRCRPLPNRRWRRPISPIHSLLHRSATSLSRSTSACRGCAAAAARLHGQRDRKPKVKRASCRFLGSRRQRRDQERSNHGIIRLRKARPGHADVGERRGVRAGAGSAFVATGMAGNRSSRLSRELHLAARFVTTPRLRGLVKSLMRFQSLHARAVSDLLAVRE